VLQYRTHWVSPIPPRLSCFQVTLAVFLATPAPAFLRSRVHPLVSFASSPEYVTASNLPAGRNHRTPSLGFLFSFATIVQRVHSTAGFPVLPTFRPQCFSHSRRLTPPCTLWACFIPLPRPRLTLQGFSPTLSRPDSSPARSLMTFCDSLLCDRVAPSTPDPEAWPSER
jgi:hypothetical protein